MTFDNLLDYKYFVLGLEDSIKDKEFLVRIKANQSAKEIKDEDYFILVDTVDGYLTELKYHCEKKPFYKNLKVDRLRTHHLKSLFSFMTHISIGLDKRMVVRNNVSVTDFNSLYHIVKNLIEDVIENGQADNTLLSVLK